MHSKSIKVGFLEPFLRLAPLTTKICDFTQIYSTLFSFLHENKISEMYIL